METLFQVITIPRTFTPSGLLPFFKAKEIILQSFCAPDNQVCIRTSDACGRVLAAPVYSNRTNPPLLLSGPDGIVVKSEETNRAEEEKGIEVHAIRVNTGMPVPEGFDAVIPIEEVELIEEQRYRIHTRVTPFQNTIPCGADIVKEDMVMDAGHRITPFDLGALLTYGVREIPVKNWKIGLVATGDEVVPPTHNPLPGQIIDSNSYMIASYLKQSGIMPIISPIIPDDPALLAEKVSILCEECDMVLIFGGSSAGSKDFTADALELSGSLLFHGVAMAPGKPVSLARVNEKPVIGMPGPSVGALMVLHELIYPLLMKWGVPISPDIYVKGELTQEVTSFGVFDMFLLMQVHSSNGKTLITPVERRFGQMMGVKAQAILHKPRETDAFVRGSEVTVRMIRNEVHEGHT